MTPDPKHCVYIRLDLKSEREAKTIAHRLPSCEILDENNEWWPLDGPDTTITVGEVPSLPRKRELREQLAATRGRCAELQKERDQALADLLAHTERHCVDRKRWAEQVTSLQAEVARLETERDAAVAERPRAELETERDRAIRLLEDAQARHIADVKRFERERDVLRQQQECRRLTVLDLHEKLAEAEAERDVLRAELAESRAVTQKISTPTAQIIRDLVRLEVKNTKERRALDAIAHWRAKCKRAGRMVARLKRDRSELADSLAELAELSAEHGHALALLRSRLSFAPAAACRAWVRAHPAPEQQEETP